MALVALLGGRVEAADPSGSNGMFYPENVARMKQADLRPREVGALRVERYTRLSVSLACLAFALFGMPLAIIIRPRGKAMSYGFAIGLIFFYYVVLKLGASLGQTDSALAGLVILSPNIILMGLGIFMFRRTVRS